MLKWLRKYNSYILVVGGVLLMVAFLLPETIRQFGQRPIGAAAMKINGSKVSYDEAEFARREHYALGQLVAPIASLMGEGWPAIIGIGENVDHWILLNKEAQRQGFVGGREDGIEYLPNLSREVMLSTMGRFMPQDQVETRAKQTADSIVQNLIPRMMSEARLSEDEIYRALGKLHAINRMRNAYYNSAAARLSGPRLITGLKDAFDTVKVDAVFVPPEHEFSSVPEPTPDQVKAQFDRFKGTKPGQGEFGIGYLLPDRVKLAYMTIDQAAVQAAIVPDPLEVRKRFLKQFPTGTPPAGETADAVTAKIDQDVRAEKLDKVLRAIDQMIKAEFEKATRKLESEGEYKRLPADWAKSRPDFSKLRDTIATRVAEATGTTISPPAAMVWDAEWMTKPDVQKLPGIGESSIRRGNQSESFVDNLFKVRELAGTNSNQLQVGIPSMEFSTDSLNNRYYFMVLDARKESAPDSYQEIEQKLIIDAKRVAAFQKLKDNVNGFKLLAESTADGLDAVARSGAKTPVDELPVKKNITVREGSISPADESLDQEDFRKAVLAQALKLDPLTDITGQDVAMRTVVVPIPKSLGLGVARIMSVSPLTEEKFRSVSSRAGMELLKRMRSKDEAGKNPDPFALSAMEERLKVEYTDGREKKKAEGKGKEQAS